MPFGSDLDHLSAEFGRKLGTMSRPNGAGPRVGERVLDPTVLGGDHLDRNRFRTEKGSFEHPSQDDEDGQNRQTFGPLSHLRATLAKDATLLARFRKGSYDRTCRA